MALSLHVFNKLIKPFGIVAISNSAKRKQRVENSAQREELQRQRQRLAELKENLVSVRGEYKQSQRQLAKRASKHTDLKRENSRLNRKLQHLTDAKQENSKLSRQVQKLDEKIKTRDRKIEHLDVELRKALVKEIDSKLKQMSLYSEGA